MLGEKQHVVAAIAQRRNGDGHGGDAEVKVFAKGFVGHGGAQILVGRGDDAHVDFDLLRAADALEAALFQHAQQLALDGQRQLANFVEEKRAAMRQFHLADLARARAGVGAALVSEELVFDQPFGNGGAVQGHKRLLGARAEVMDGAREKFLAGAAFAQQQNRGIGGGHALRHLARFLHGGMLADDAREAVARGVFLAQQQIFAQQFLLRARRGPAADSR